VARLALYAAMFHLFTHAFFKALLFLASGSVMHAMGDVIDMRRFGGLRNRLPYTYWTFLVGALALSGIFPTAGFFSKDEILLALQAAPETTREMGLNWGWVYTLIYWTAVVTAFMTAFYTFRAFFMTFWGPEKLPSPDDPEAPKVEADGHDHGHDDHAHGHDDGHGHHHIGEESPPLMTFPLIALAACAALAGVVFGTTGWFESHLEGTLGFERLVEAHHVFGLATPILSTIVAVAGVALAYVMYAEPSPWPARVASSVRPLYRASVNKFYVDEIYHWTVMKALLGLAVASKILDVELVDRLVVGIARMPGRLGRDVLAGYQNGLLQFYAAVSALSVVVLLVILLFI
jgi:NADH-quinone oxidoreductase subunit L